MLNIYELLGLGILGVVVLFVILVNEYRFFFETIKTYVTVYFKVRLLNRTFLFSKTRVRKSVSTVNGLLQNILLEPYVNKTDERVNRGYKFSLKHNLSCDKIDYSHIGLSFYSSNAFYDKINKIAYEEDENFKLSNKFLNFILAKLIFADYEKLKNKSLEYSPVKVYEDAVVKLTKILKKLDYIYTQKNVSNTDTVHDDAYYDRELKMTLIDYEQVNNTIPDIKYGSTYSTILKDISDRFQVVFERSDQYVFYYAEIIELLKSIENKLNSIGELNAIKGHQR